MSTSVHDTLEEAIHRLQQHGFEECTAMASRQHETAYLCAFQRQDVVVPVLWTPKGEKSAIHQFKMDWTKIGQCRMFAHPIVKALNILKKCSSRLFSRSKRHTRGTFTFERSKETLDDCILPTIAFPTHAARNPVLFEQGLIRLARVLASTVRMVK
jgi:hypothetical protein